MRVCSCAILRSACSFTSMIWARDRGGAGQEVGWQQSGARLDSAGAEDLAATTAASTTKPTTSSRFQHRASAHLRIRDVGNGGAASARHGPNAAVVVGHHALHEERMVAEGLKVATCGCALAYQVTMKQLLRRAHSYHRVQLTQSEASPPGTCKCASSARRRCTSAALRWAAASAAALSAAS